jgi:hypothetical protein
MGRMRVLQLNLEYSSILNVLGHRIDGCRYIFTMDNLNAHTNVRVTTMILDEGHHFMFRAPYCATVDGAIEYVFNTIECMFRIRSPDIKDVQSL